MPLSPATRQRPIGPTGVSVTLRTRVTLHRFRAAAPSLGRLARGLTAPEPIPARGIALAQIVLCDGASPLYDANAEASVVDYARRCAKLLEDDDL